jgi:lysophosphatidate acyltransferase
MSFVISLIKPIVYISLPALLLRSVASSSPKGRYYVRIGVYIGTLTLVATWGVVVAAAMSLAGRRYDVNYVVARTFYAITKRVLDITVEVENEEGVGIRPVVLMSNHQSMLDIILLGRFVFVPF